MEWQLPGQDGWGEVSPGGWAPEKTEKPPHPEGCLLGVMEALGRVQSKQD